MSESPEKSPLPDSDSEHLEICRFDNLCSLHRSRQILEPELQQPTPLKDSETLSQNCGLCNALSSSDSTFSVFPPPLLHPELSRWPHCLAVIIIICCKLVVRTVGCGGGEEDTIWGLLPHTGCPPARTARYAGVVVGVKCRDIVSPTKENGGRGAAVRTALGKSSLFEELCYI